MEALYQISFQIAVMFLLVLCGYVLFRKNFISVKTSEQLSRIVISVVNPALMFSSYNTTLDKSLIEGLGQAFAIAALIHILFIAVSKLIIPRKNNQNYGLERYCCIYSNCAFIGIPLVSSVCGSEGVFYLTAYITVFNLLMWSHGIFLLSRKTNFSFVRNVLFSPTIIATLLGMFVFFLQIKVPAIILKPIDYISNMNTPLAMMIAGATIAQSNIKQAFKKSRIYIIAFIKLLLIPLGVLLILIHFQLNQVALLATIIAAACPVATSSTLLAIRYNLDAKYASQIFGLTTVISMISLPVILLIANFGLS